MNNLPIFQPPCWGLPLARSLAQKLSEELAFARGGQSKVGKWLRSKAPKSSFGMEAGRSVAEGLSSAS